MELGERQLLERPAPQGSMLIYVSQPIGTQIRGQQLKGLLLSPFCFIRELEIVQPNSASRYQCARQMWKRSMQITQWHFIEI